MVDAEHLKNGPEQGPEQLIDQQADRNETHIVTEQTAPVGGEDDGVSPRPGYEVRIVPSDDPLRSAAIARKLLGRRDSEIIFDDTIFDSADQFTNQELNTGREKQPMKLAINKITDGLGFGNGPISANKIKEEVGQEVLAKADEVINSPAILVEVSKDEHGNELDDDGCGDGRFTKRIFDKVKEYRKSLNRYKVFGGGATMVAAARIGAGTAHGLSAEQNFAGSIEDCGDKGINFGAHTDEHAEGANCGCGAIDKNPLIIAAAKQHRQKIFESFDALGVDTEGVNEILDNYAAYADEIADDSTFAGSTVMRKIINVGKIVKQLGGKHIEGRIVLNFVDGYTVNQAAVRDATDGKVDVFAVDVPRLQKIAEKLNPNDELAQARAFKSMLVYTLATAAVLTAGDEPVWAVKLAPVEQPQLVAA